jgi:molybdenum cofactor synthesis domain-containing protein
MSSHNSHTSKSNIPSQSLIRASILAIGTEVVSGQIWNTNSRWLAVQLENMGVTVEKTLAVPDDISKIHSALEWAQKDTQWVFLCGGLGPTRDDLTRTAVSEWTGRPLVFVEEAWENIRSIFQARGREPQEVQRSGAMILEDSQYLPNPAGTAASFLWGTREKLFIVLPGPPREIDAIWQRSLEKILRSYSPARQRRLHTWLSLGLGESDVAAKVEPALDSLSGVEIGYRLMAPFVEVKVWSVDLSESFELKLDQTLRTQLGASFFRKGSVGFGPQLFEHLFGLETPLEIVDNTFGAPLARKALELWPRSPSTKARLSISIGGAEEEKKMAPPPDRCVLSLEKQANGFLWRLYQNGKKSEGTTPRLFPDAFEERNALAATELTLRAVYESLIP